MENSGLKIYKRPMSNWDKRWIGLIDHYAEWSKDLNTKVGCVIVSQDNDQLSQGYNDFPRGFFDDEDNKLGRRSRPEKYLWTEHAERNAIYNAARNGVSLKGAKIYVVGVPCTACARGIRQSGITDVYIPYGRIFSPNNKKKWTEDAEYSKQLLSEVNITIWELYDPKLK